MNREVAWALVCEWVTSPNLRKHMLAVEAAMRAYAERFGEGPDLWGVIGLLHDLDYERFPSQEAGHPFRGVEALRAMGAPEEITRAILSHADYSGVPRESLMEKALFACDELTGFIIAVALVKPGRSIAEVDVASVKKKMKDKAFARGVSREDIYRGAEELGIPLDEHIGIVLAALQGIAGALDLGG
jgi:putative nucleotidyltransferase with HDIG domain